MTRNEYLIANYGCEEYFKTRLKEDGTLIDKLFEENGPSSIHFEDIMIALDTYEGAKSYLPPECFNLKSSSKLCDIYNIQKGSESIPFCLSGFIDAVDNPNDYLKIINSVENINFIKRLGVAQDKCYEFRGQFEFFKYIIQGNTDILYKFLEFIGINSHFNKNLLRLIPYADRPEDLFFFLSENISKDVLLDNDVFHLGILNFITYYFRIYLNDSDIDTYVKAFSSAIYNEEFFKNHKYQIQIFVEDIISFINEKNLNLKDDNKSQVDSRYKDYSYLIDILFEKVSNHWPEEDRLNLFKMFKDFIGNFNCKCLTEEFKRFYYSYSIDFQFLTSIFNQIRY